MFWGSPSPRLLAAQVEISTLARQVEDLREQAYCLECELAGLSPDLEVLGLMAEACEQIDAGTWTEAFRSCLEGC